VGEKGQEYRKLFNFPILHQGQSAELIAEKWKISREELDKFSGASHEKAAVAQEKGYFKRESIF
jgi:acetyl-CoA acetyltransferase